jgi:ferrous iron transport protein A
MPIVFAPFNTELTIIKILADETLKKHLESLGIVVNQKIEVLSNASGALICLIKDSRVALDRNLSTKILVRC